MAHRGPRDVEYLSLRQRAVIHHYVMGKTHKGIAEITGYTYKHVSILITSQAGRKYAWQYQDKLEARYVAEKMRRFHSL